MFSPSWTGYRSPGAASELADMAPTRYGGGSAHRTAPSPATPSSQVLHSLVRQSGFRESQAPPEETVFSQPPQRQADQLRGAAPALRVTSAQSWPGPPATRVTPGRGLCTQCQRPSKEGYMACHRQGCADPGGLWQAERPLSETVGGPEMLGTEMAEAQLGMASQRGRGDRRTLTPLMARRLAVAYPELDGT
ncbi:hypothetical protein NDU88_000779 [Pleurodeles waltl]|uniref:Uncharacterized protein n=1 Tax=Pleurodeles waltl TaxID=8319 RepID=A0AAV7TGS6_PLEWA|nr:hypothetical protein NDU88_000779 [Pleurodeles waltl]